MTSFFDLPEEYISDGLIVFISGVPGAGKTTLSYELLRMFNNFRVVQETDLLREILRGYNEYLQAENGQTSVSNNLIAIPDIPDHTRIFNYAELVKQCIIMKNSIEKIVARQQRKGIPSIINGVHIVPEVLNGVMKNRNVVFLNLFINCKDALKSRLSSRDAKKYMPYLDMLFETNCDLHNSVMELEKEMPFTFTNIDVTKQTIEQTVNDGISFIRKHTISVL